MKREIKFHGKRVDNGEWVYGWYATDDLAKLINHYISEHNYSSEMAVNVIPETVGQYTGLKDRYGIEIYEGDIIRRNTGYVFEVKERQYSLGSVNDAKAFGYEWHQSDEVIGNIYDTPELLNTPPVNP